MSNAYDAARPDASTTRQASRGKSTAANRYGAKAARRGQMGTAKELEPTRRTPPALVMPRIVTVSVGDKITGEIGRYAGTLFGLKIDPAATGNLSTANLGATYDACDVWYPPEIGASEAKLVSGTIAFGWVGPEPHATRHRPIVTLIGIGSAGGGGAIFRAQVVSLDSPQVANIKPFGMTTSSYTPAKALLCQGHAVDDSLYVSPVPSTPITGVGNIEIFTLMPMTDQGKVVQVIDGYGRIGLDWVRAT